MPSEEASRAGLSGKVQVKCIVGTDGKAHDIRVVRPLGLGLDEKALEAVSQWEFQPGTMAGQPVSIYATVDVTFVRLDTWHLARVDFDLPPGASRPMVEKTRHPHASSDAAPATATVAFDVDEKGEPVNLKVEKNVGRRMGSGGGRSGARMEIQARTKGRRTTFGSLQNGVCSW